MPPLHDIIVPTKLPSSSKPKSFQVPLNDSSVHSQDVKPRRPIRKRSMDTSDHCPPLFEHDSAGSDSKPAQPTRRVSLEFVKSILESAKADCIPILPPRRRTIELTSGTMSPVSKPRRHTCHAAECTSVMSLDDSSSYDQLSVDSEATFHE